MPEVNFSGHCWEPASPQLPNLYSCPNIEEGIKACQQMGKKVLISLGGATGKNDLTDEKAKVLAKNLWDLFLGGKERSDIRPFGRWNNITSNRKSWSIVSHKGWGGGRGGGKVWWEDSGCVTKKLTRAPRLCNILMPLFAPPSLPTSYWLLIGSRFFLVLLFKLWCDDCFPFRPLFL